VVVVPEETTTEEEGEIIHEEIVLPTEVPENCAQNLINLVRADDVDICDLTPRYVRSEDYHIDATEYKQEE
jgi:hypothetical protein